MLALHDKKEIHGTFREGSRAEYAPLKWSISPAQDGQTGPNGLRLSTIQDADPVPAGKVATGETVQLVKGKPKRVLTLADAVFTVADVKAQAALRILEYCPEWKQRNLTAQAAILAEKGRAKWTAEEAAAWESGEAIWAHITAIRAASEKLEALDPIPDPATWAGWP
jgi:hypothetical protein